MKVEMLLVLIPIVYLLYELYHIITGLEQKKYVYGQSAHSIEHFVYLFSKIVTLVLLIAYIYSWDKIIFNYFIFMMSFNTMFITRHIYKERIDFNQELLGKRKKP